MAFGGKQGGDGAFYGVDNQQFTMTRRPALTLLHDDIIGDEERPPVDLNRQRQTLGSQQQIEDVQVKCQSVSELSNQQPPHSSPQLHQFREASQTDNVQFQQLKQPLPEDSSRQQDVVEKVKDGLVETVSEDDDQETLVSEANAEFDEIMSNVPLRLLFRRPLPKPALSHVDEPWYYRQEDSALRELWEPQWKTTSTAAKNAAMLSSLPSTVTVYQQLCQKRVPAGAAEHQSVPCGNREKQIAQNRLFLERQNILRDIEDMKTREEILSGLKLALTSCNLFRLIGGNVFPLPQDVRFADCLSVRPVASKSYSSWSCSTLTLDDLRNALRFFNPPLFQLPPFPKVSLDDPQLLPSTPPLRMPTVVAEHFALVVELRIKHTLFTILKKLAGRQGAGAAHISLQAIELLLRENLLQGFPWDTPAALEDIKIRCLQHDINERIRESVVGDVAEA